MSPQFEYRGLGPQDTLVEGQIFAANHDQANQLLEQMQVKVNDLKAKSPDTKSVLKGISRGDFAMLNEQIIAMVKAGVPLESGLQQLAGDLAKPRLRKLVNNIAEDLASGTSLEEAIRKRQQAFPVMYAQIIGVGMRTGKLSVVLAGLNRYLEFEGTMRRIIWEALNYPLAVLLLGLGVLWTITRLLGPGFETIFLDFGTTLPVPTQFFLQLGNNLAWLFPATVGTIGIIVITVHLARWPGARRVKEQLLLGLPLIGPMLKNCLIARFAQGLAFMVRAGIPLEESVQFSGEATGSPAVSADSRRIRDALTRGQPVPQALQAGRIIPRFLGQTIQIALDRNQLQECLEELSHLYDHRAQQGLSTLRAILLPLMIVFLGGTIGMYVIAMFLPLVKLISSVSGGK